MGQLWSMWGLGVALMAIAFIGAVASRQRWLIVSNGGLLLMAFALGGIDGWPGDLVLLTGLAISGIGFWRERPNGRANILTVRTRDR